MAIERNDPYGAFNYVVSITPEAGDRIEASFSDVSGLGTEIQYSEYRDGDDPTNGIRKIPNTFKATDVTLKRGLIGSRALWSWVEAVRNGDPQSRATVSIELKSEDRSTTVSTWLLEGARPSKWTGPTLAAKGGSDVAMEELTLVCENIKFE